MEKEYILTYVSFSNVYSFCCRPLLLVSYCFSFQKYVGIYYNEVGRRRFLLFRSMGHNERARESIYICDSFFFFFWRKRAERNDARESHDDTDDYCMYCTNKIFIVVVS